LPRWLTTVAASVVALGSASAAPASPTDAVRAALEDCRRLPPAVRVQARYLDLTALPEGERADAVRVFKYHANSLSREPEMGDPVPVGKTLVRLHLADYGWKAEVWDRLAEIDPYYHATVEVQKAGYYAYDQYGRGYWQAGKKVKQTGTAPWLPPREMAELVAMTQSAAPLLRADWWFAQTSRQLDGRNQNAKAGYYDFLGVKSRDDFFRLVKLREKDSVEVGKEIRAVLERSGVATQNRQVVRLQSLTGGVWFTLDTDDSTGKGNALENIRAGQFQHKAEEFFAPLANGLFAFLLCDEKGNLQATAPDFIGADDSPGRSGRDARIHVGISCLRCHGAEDGLRSIDDWARRTLRLPLGVATKDYDEIVRLRRQYTSNLDRQLRKDREVFSEAVRDCVQMTVPELSRAYNRLYEGYWLRDVTVAQAARELGVTEERLIEAVKDYGKRYKTLPAVLAPFVADPPGTVRVEHWEEYQSVVNEIVGTYRP
jgi:hypothetical protein